LFFIFREDKASIKFVYEERLDFVDEILESAVVHGPAFDSSLVGLSEQADRLGEVLQSAEKLFILRKMRSTHCTM